MTKKKHTYIHSIARLQLVASSFATDDFFSFSSFFFANMQSKHDLFKKLMAVTGFDWETCVQKRIIEI